MTKSDGSSMPPPAPRISASRLCFYSEQPDGSVLSWIWNGTVWTLTGELSTSDWTITPVERVVQLSP